MVTSKSKNFFHWMFPAYLWAAIILFLTSYPKVEIPILTFSAKDKLAHFVVYCILNLLFLRGLSRYSTNKLLNALKKGTTFCIIFAIFDEMHQIFIPGRFADFRDGLANIIGVCFAPLIFIWIIVPLVRRKEHHS